MTTTKKNGKIPIAGPFSKASCCAGDKLAVTSWEKDGEICCIALIKAGNLESMVKGMLGPVMKEIL